MKVQDFLHAGSWRYWILMMLIIFPATGISNVKLAYVTGATGCVGRNIVEELLSRNWDVVVLHRASSDLSRLDGCQVRFQEVNLHSYESVRQAIPEGVQAIFHAAGNTSHWAKERAEQWQDNVLATRYLANVAVEKKVERFIFTSTGATLGLQWTDSPQDLATETNSYIRTKRQAELEVYQAVRKGLDAVFLHPIIVVGEYDYNSYAQLFTFLKTSKVRFAFEGSIMFCHARDVAIGHVNAYETGRSCERYVLGGPHHSWQEFSEEVARLVTPDNPRVMVAPRKLLKTIAAGAMVASFFNGKKPFLSMELVNLLRDAPGMQVYDEMKAREINYESRPLRQMVQDCYHWLLKTGRL